MHAGALKMAITAFYPIPTSWSKKKRTAAIGGAIRPTVKPDADNVLKVICDALNGIAYADDKQIVEAAVRKFYVMEPAVVVEIEEV